MIEIIEAHNTVAFEGVKSTLHVEIKIDGYSWTLVALPVKWDKTEVLKYINKHYDDILRQAKLSVNQEPTGITVRADLLTN